MEFDSQEFWDAFNERAAIMEFDGGLSRKEAEKAAFKDVCLYCR